MTKEARVLARAKAQAKAHGLRAIRMAMQRGVEGGWPDLVILGPNRGVLFMETKRRGKPLTPLQEERRREIVEDYGHLYSKPDTNEAVDHAIKGFAEFCNRRGFE